MGRFSAPYSAFLVNKFTDMDPNFVSKYLSTVATLSKVIYLEVIYIVSFLQVQHGLYMTL